MFDLKHTSINAIELKKIVIDPNCGGFTSFEGWVRNTNQGKHVNKLAYEAYPKLAIKEGNRIVKEASKMYEINKALCVHRTGVLEIGDIAIWIGVSAAHRDPAFKACRYILDQVKSRVPIWKKEIWTDGESGWIEQE